MSDMKWFFFFIFSIFLVDTPLLLLLLLLVVVVYKVVVVGHLELSAGLHSSRSLIRTTTCYSQGPFDTSQQDAF